MQEPDSLILVFDGDSGVRAMLLDVIRKASGREDCALCEIAYSPVGKRREWIACEARLGLPVSEMHRDQVPGEWGLDRAQLPCVLARAGNRTPTLLLSRDEIAACRGSADELERRIRDALARLRLPMEAGARQHDAL